MKYFIRKYTIPFGFFIATLLLSYQAACANSESNPPSAKRILLLYSYHPTFITSDSLLRGVRSVLDSYDITLNIEYMDSKRQNDEPYMEHLFKLLKDKMSRRAP